MASEQSVSGSLFQVVYVSSTNWLLSRNELKELLSVARHNNASLGITGLLLYKGGNVMQVLEGETGKVETLLAKIFRDRRHSGAKILLQHSIDNREYKGWDMALSDLSNAYISTPEYEGNLADCPEPEAVGFHSKSAGLLTMFAATIR